MENRKWMRRALWITLACIIIVLASTLAALFLSRPQVSGFENLIGLDHPVAVSRDIIGHTKIQARSREDIARAAGFIHAQERFLSMDLRRRFAAGEIAALLGTFGLGQDRENRPHRFREKARKIVTGLSEKEHAILRAYAEGVNQGLEALPVWPFPYVLFLTRPDPWKPEDSILSLFAMHLVLQGGRWKYDSVVGVLHEVFGADVTDFLVPVGTHHDAPLDDTPIPLYLPRVPEAHEIDLRSTPLNPENIKNVRMSWETPGSNAFAVSGDLSSHDSALLANDMHLVLLVPNIWYRMHWQWKEDGTSHMVSGLTLPGLPWLIAGSNGRIAWGFTNSNVDSQDLIELSPGDASLTTIKETLEVRFGMDEKFAYEVSPWGPVVSETSENRKHALRWASYWLTGDHINFSQIETSEDARSAIPLFQKSAIPGQNVVMADHKGNIAWTIAGILPKRDGYSGRIPIGSTVPSLPPQWLSLGEYPVEINPPGQRLWSANSRHVGGERFAVLGDGRYTSGMRARQIRNRLREQETFRESDLLAIQRDNRAEYLDEWYPRIERAMNQPSVTPLVKRHRIREWLEKWNGRSDADSVGYRIMRNFRKRSHELFLLALQTRLSMAPDRHVRHIRWQLDGPLTRILDSEAQNFLPKGMRTWDEFLALALELTIKGMTKDGREDMADATWGAHNYARIRHPLSHILPFLSGFLDAPPSPLSGDLNLPRVEHRAFGASHRTVVSPGREERAIMNMPTGQSGHPLSPFYNAGHMDWLEGKPSPFLPGPAVTTLTLAPSLEH